MAQQSFTGHTTYGTAGGILTIFLANISSGDVFRTAILAAIGALVSYSMSYFLEILPWKVAKINCNRSGAAAGLKNATAFLMGSVSKIIQTYHRVNRQYHTKLISFLPFIFFLNNPSISS